MAFLAKDHYFRMLSDDEAEAVSIIDNRKVGKEPNNKILVTCDHASNDLKGFKANPRKPRDSTRKRTEKSGGQEMN